ncbi:MAG: hypothetical protein NTV40_00920 [Solirubrobacterales bacterium]|nr:hypothetical protein [Solirubrobacterales bacterium]
MAPKPAEHPIVAGSLALTVLVICAAVGYGIGSLVDAEVPLGLVGLFTGVIAGFAVVYARFKDL